jgi:hypothetical protein
MAGDTGTRELAFNPFVTLLTGRFGQTVEKDVSTTMSERQLPQDCVALPAGDNQA